MAVHFASGFLARSDGAASSRARGDAFWVCPLFAPDAKTSALPRLMSKKDDRKPLKMGAYFFVEPRRLSRTISPSPVSTISSGFFSHIGLDRSVSMFVAAASFREAVGRSCLRVGTYPAGSRYDF